MKEVNTYRELFFSLFEAAKQAETELCKSRNDPHGERAKKVLADVIDQCYEKLREWES